MDPTVAPTPDSTRPTPALRPGGVTARRAGECPFPPVPTTGLVGDLLGPVVRALGLAPSRRHSGRPGRTHVEVRGVATLGEAATRKDVVEELLAVPGVEGAVVNAVIGRVVVDHAPDVGLDRLVAVVEEVERGHGLDRAPADTSGYHPADVTPWSRQVLALGVDLAGLGMAGVERWLGLVPLTRSIPPLLTGTLSLLDAVPSSHTAAERTAGGATTESWFSLGSSTLQALGRGADLGVVSMDPAALRTADRVDLVVLGESLADHLGGAAAAVERVVVVEDAATAGRSPRRAKALICCSRSATSRRA